MIKSDKLYLFRSVEDNCFLLNVGVDIYIYLYIYQVEPQIGGQQLIPFILNFHAFLS